MLVLQLYIKYDGRRLRFALKIATGSLSGGGSLNGPCLYIISSFIDLEAENSTRDHHGVGPRAPAFCQPLDQFRQKNL
jgi:hypothetical protein